MNGKLAICIPTRNNPKMIKSVLDEWIKILKERDISIIVYDSSSESETKNILNEYGNIYKNITYVITHKEYSYGEKVDYIFKDSRLNSYDYIWPIKDRAYCNEIMLQRITESFEDNCDIIFPVNSYTVEGIYDISSAVDFYRHFAVQATSLESAIYNKRTIIDTFETKIQDTDKSVWDFWHYKCLFEGIAKLEKPKIRIISENDAVLLNKKKNSSYWEKDIFTVWKDNWIKVNDELPFIYNGYKDSVIKRTVSIEQIIGGRTKLIQLHDKGILTEIELNHVLDKWERISDIPKEIVIKIAKGKYDIFHDLTQLRSDNEAISILKSIYVLLEKGMSVDEVPIEDIERIILDEVLKGTKYFDEEKYLVYGSIQDLCGLMKNNDRLTAMKCIQSLLLFL